MDMTPRKQKILAAVVELYISTGEPVGSKLIMNKLDISVSSATIRNEMSELSEMGYLMQPHTSAGRVPTHAGYRYYVDKLMGNTELDEEQRRSLEAGVSHNRGDPERVLERAGELLAELTNCAAVSTMPTGGQVTIRRAELVPVSSRTAMVVILTSAGTLKSRACRSDTVITPEMVERFYAVSAAHFINRPANDVGTAMLQTLVASLGEHALEMSPFFVVLADLASDASHTEVLLEGQTNLLQHRELSANACELMDFLNRIEPLSHIFSPADGSTHIKIGSENEYKQLENSSIIVSPYSVDGSHSGTLGIIGPTRIDYAKLIPSIKFLAGLVGDLLGEALEE